ncbi:phosphatase PAP2 family protein [Jiangella ureilytica]|uniref:Phosphatase PAP2 family protein n=1 Tax=Jiangella ureilytica TaxID=2530374 RepID=A0A4R4RLQ8_9ACTN|nr:phosphatase PAP2 family protein [Jiangella ureilytica]TDC50577.1 phosphatase PAP2 family protein [Jiangella ureilytica]
MTHAVIDTTTRRRAAAVAAGLATFSATTSLAHDDLYRTVAGTAADAPSPLRALVDLVAGQGLLVLVATAVLVALSTAVRGERDRFLLTVAAGIGTVLSYGASELLKATVTAERPCMTAGVDIVLGCPPHGDWSWPSNHATIAAALATACLLVAPRLWPLVVPAAAAVAVARVAGGVHYPHDVLAWAALGVAVTAAAGVLAPRWVSVYRRSSGRR